MSGRVQVSKSIAFKAEVRLDFGAICVKDKNNENEKGGFFNWRHSVACCVLGFYSCHVAMLSSGKLYWLCSNQSLYIERDAYFVTVYIKRNIVSKYVARVRILLH